MQSLVIDLVGQECAAGWTSMKGRVAFWIRFDQVQGIVRFKLYGQTCKRCEERAAEKPSATHKPLEFQHSMWYIEEVEKVFDLVSFNFTK